MLIILSLYCNNAMFIDCGTDSICQVIRYFKILKSELENFLLKLFDGIK